MGKQTRNQETAHYWWQSYDGDDQSFCAVCALMNALYGKRLTASEIGARIDTWFATYSEHLDLKRGQKRTPMTAARAKLDQEGYRLKSSVRYVRGKSTRVYWIERKPNPDHSSLDSELMITDYRNRGYDFPEGVLRPYDDTLAEASGVFIFCTGLKPGEFHINRAAHFGERLRALCATYPDGDFIAVIEGDAPDIIPEQVQKQINAARIGDLAWNNWYTATEICDWLYDGAPMMQTPENNRISSNRQDAVALPSIPSFEKAVESIMSTPCAGRRLLLDYAKPYLNSPTHRAVIEREFGGIVVESHPHEIEGI